VLVEAGPTLAAAFLAAGCCDELVVYVAPVLLGRDAQPAWALPSPARLAEATRLELVEAAAIGEDVRLVLRPGGSAATLE
jgi:diaminohydroxyphosphoribosylaminopyrimidine deaminase / 5-amino-6-(5-phosphoribosylamino)uracil reductase